MSDRRLIRCKNCGEDGVLSVTTKSQSRAEEALYLPELCDLCRNENNVSEKGTAMINKKCFVIMPFSPTSEKHTEEYWDAFFETIKNEVEMHNYTCNRSETGPHNIVRQIVDSINESDLVVAVLTDLNPNVWCELGIRHSLRNGTLMLMEDGQRIPFDISNYGVERYPDSIALATTLKKKVKSYIDKLDKNSVDSPVLETLGFSSKQKNKFDELQSNLDKTNELILKIASEKSRELPNMPVPKNKYNRILWVDDFPSNNQLIIDFFENKNVRFDIAINTQQGINLLNDHKYDIIITDMGRGEEPDAGIKLIKLIKSMPSKTDIPILVFASTTALRNYGELAITLGAVATTNGMGEAIAHISGILDSKPIPIEEARELLNV
jgi:CheY-like chemotaxis protein